MFTMLTKRAQVAVNAKALERVKKRFGEFLAMGKLIGSLLNDVADGRLFYNDGHWYSTETPMSGNVKDVDNVGGNFGDLVEDERNNTSEPEIVVDARPTRAKNCYFDCGHIYDTSKSDEDLIDDLWFDYQQPLENSEDFDWDLYTDIFRLKFGNEREKGDGYTENVDLGIPSLYNYCKWNNREKIVRKIESIISQAKRWLEQEGPKSFKTKKK